MEKSQKTKAENLHKEISLPKGENVFSAYQYHNGNGKPDASMMGIPKEKFSLSNYDAKSPPRRIQQAQSDNRLKVSRNFLVHWYY